MKILVRPFTEDVDNGKIVPEKVYILHRCYANQIMIMDAEEKKMYTIKRDRVLKVITEDEK
jgi:hypothetical protein